MILKAIYMDKDTTNKLDIVYTLEDLHSATSLYLGNIQPLFMYALCRMKEQRDRADREHQEELDHYLRTTKDLKARTEELNRLHDEKQVKLSMKEMRRTNKKYYSA